MENVVTRHRNLVLLVALLFLQVIGLAVQVKRPGDHGSTTLIRLWAVRLVTPMEKAVVYGRNWAGGVWSNYFYLRGVRQENRDLRAEIQQLRLERVRMAEDANQARRLQALLEFREQFISGTQPAQVISTTGTDFSRAIFIDKGSKQGIRPDMPVINPDGVVGKVFRVYPSSSLVLLISDPSSGAGVILEKSRLQGILKGTPEGETVLNNVMSDEKVAIGDRVVTSGGDRVFPKGLPVGTVTEVSPGNDLFLKIKVKPVARLERMEEVLVITRLEERVSPPGEDLAGPVRAVDILAQRLPSVPAKPEAGSGDKSGSSLPPPTRNLPAPTSGLPPVAGAAPRQGTAPGTATPPTQSPSSVQPGLKPAQPEPRRPGQSPVPAGQAVSGPPRTSPERLAERPSETGPAAARPASPGPEAEKVSPAVPATGSAETSATQDRAR